MKAHLLAYWDRLRSGFWFVPGIMTGAAVALAFATVALDESATVEDWKAGQSWAYTGGAEGRASMADRDEPPSSVMNGIRCWPRNRRPVTR